MFVAGAALKCGYDKMDIISGVGHPKLDSVVLLVLCTVTCNGWGTGIVLQASWDSTNPVEKGKKSWVDHT